MPRPALPLLSRSRFLRFVVAGAANTLFGFAVYSAAIVGGLPVWAALVVGNLAGMAFNFMTTSGYVFRSLLLSRVPRFAGAYLVTYLVNLLLIRWLANWIEGSILQQAILTLPMAVFSYLLLKRFVFGPVPAGAARDPP